MIYLFSISFCVLLIYYYEILGYEKNKYKWYNILLLLAICISAFQYRLGADILTYMDKYESFNTAKVSFDTFFSGEDRRQPGWMLLVYLCRQITPDYFLMKCLQAIVLNISVFAFFRRESKYIFSCILLYFVFSYLVLNFNILRQSYAIALGLYAFSYSKEKKWGKYVLFTFLAYMFHNSALLLLVFPILKTLDFLMKGKKGVFLCIAMIFCVYAFMTTVDLEPLFESLFTSSLSDDMGEQAMAYMGQEKLGVQSEFSVFSLKRLLVALLVIVYIFSQKNWFVGSQGIIYLLILLLTAFMPIFWRFRLYFEFAYFLIVSQVAFEITIKLFHQKFKLANLFAFFVMLLAIYHPVQDYLTVYPGSRYRYIDQYYPYQNIFTKNIDKQKERYFSQF